MDIIAPVLAFWTCADIGCSRFTDEEISHLNIAVAINKDCQLLGFGKFDFLNALPTNTVPGEILESNWEFPMPGTSTVERWLLPAMKRAACPEHSPAMGEPPSLLIPKNVSIYKVTMAMLRLQKLSREYADRSKKSRKDSGMIAASSSTIAAARSPDYNWAGTIPVAPRGPFDLWGPTYMNRTEKFTLAQYEEYLAWRHLLDVYAKIGDDDPLCMKRKMDLYVKLGRLSPAICRAAAEMIYQDVYVAYYPHRSSRFAPSGSLRSLRYRTYNWVAHLEARQIMPIYHLLCFKKSTQMLLRENVRRLCLNLIGINLPRSAILANVMVVLKSFTQLTHLELVLENERGMWGSVMAATENHVYSSIEFLELTFDGIGYPNAAPVPFVLRNTFPNLQALEIHSFLPEGHDEIDVWGLYYLRRCRITARPRAVEWLADHCRNLNELILWVDSEYYINLNVMEFLHIPRLEIHYTSKPGTAVLPFAVKVEPKLDFDIRDSKLEAYVVYGTVMEDELAQSLQQLIGTSPHLKHMVIIEPWEVVKSHHTIQPRVRYHFDMVALEHLREIYEVRDLVPDDIDPSYELCGCTGSLARH